MSKTIELTTSPLYGLVLSGGKSTRMGIDKGSINYNGLPQRRYVFEMLSGICEKVFTSCRKDQHIESSLNPLTDLFDIEGPMNGIVSAFTSHPARAFMIVAIDMPNVNESVLLTLAANRDPQKLATCFYDEKQSAPEPMLTIFEPSAFPLLKANLANGNKSPRAFLQANNVKYIQQSDPDLFLNINFPDQRDTWIKQG